MKYIAMFKQSKVLIGVCVLIGLILGLLWGWVIQPVEWTDAQPTTLAASYQEDLLRMTIDSYRLNADLNLAKARFAELGDKGPSLFQAIRSNPNGIDPNFLLVFERDLNISASGNTQTSSPATTAEATPQQPTESTSVAPTNSSWFSGLLIVIGIILALGMVAVAIYIFLRRRAAEFSDEDEEEDEEYQDEFEGSPHQYNYQANEPMSSDLNPFRAERPIFNQNLQQPFARFQTNYVMGDDNYNDSFSIDSRTGEFLGECGFGVSEFIGVGSPKKASAFEIWMFDKNDIQTITKVLMSPFAYKDPGYRARLEAKGELIEIQQHKQIKLETATLFMIATITNVAFGQGMTADPSHIESVSVDLSVWQK